MKSTRKRLFFALYLFFFNSWLRLLSFNCFYAFCCKHLRNFHQNLNHLMFVAYNPPTKLFFILVHLIHSFLIHESFTGCCDFSVYNEHFSIMNLKVILPYLILIFLPFIAHNCNGEFDDCFVISTTSLLIQVCHDEKGRTLYYIKELPSWIICTNR